MTSPDPASPGDPRPRLQRPHERPLPRGPIPSDDERALRVIADLIRRDGDPPSPLAQALLAHLELTTRRHRQVRDALARLEARSTQGDDDDESLESRVRSVESSLVDVCRLLRELDDPYGLGLSVDEQLAAEEENGPC